MLSVGSRDGNGGFGSQAKGLGFGGGGEMDETELEEGEACYYHDNDTSIDPDIDLSYLDEKLQDVLGHFQKDFEGGVSAENLGAQFGGYGSFLPTYQRSPSIRSHPKTPQRLQSCITIKSPNAIPFEGSRQNSTMPSNASFPVRPAPPNNSAAGPAASFTDNSAKRDMFTFSAQSASKSSPKYESVPRSVNGTDQKTLKVRIKVSSDNVSARKNAEIYSGLGLDISPSSSLEESPEDSGRLSPTIRDAPDESLMAILEIMTAIQISGGFLLSPLPDFLLHLREKEKPLVKDSKPGALRKSNQEGSFILDYESPSVTDKGHAEKKTRSVEKNGRSMELKNMNSKDVGNDTDILLKTEIDVETPMGRELVNNALKLPLLSSSRSTHEKSERQNYSDTVKGSGISASEPLTEPNVDLTKDIALSSNSVKEEVFDSSAHHDTNRASSSGSELAVSLKGKLNSKPISVEKVWEDRKANNHKDPSFDPRKDGRGKSDIKFDTAKDLPRETPKQNNPHKATSNEQGGVKVQQGKEQLLGVKKKSKDSQSNGTLGVDLPKERLKIGSSMAPKEKKKHSHSKDYYSETQLDAVKPHKESSKTASKDNHRDSVGVLKMEVADNRIDSLDSYYKNKSKESRLESLEMEHHGFAEKPKERSGGKKIENLSAFDAYTENAAVAPPMGTGPISDAPIVPADPVLIKENWVCCDRCQKWRLLPFGTDPDHLPKKWRCSMLDWLRGMNNCSFSEEETTNATNALYQVPVVNQNNIQSQHDGAMSGITLADVRHIDQGQEPSTFPSGGKKRNITKDIINTPALTTLTHVPNSSKKNQQSSVKSRSLNDVNQYTFEPSQANRTGKANEFSVEKQRNKQKERQGPIGCYSDRGAGDYIESSGKHSKTKSKREGEQDGSKTSKKIKTGGSLYTDDEWRSDHDFAGKVGMSNGFLTEHAGKNVQNHNGFPSKYSKCDTMENSLTAVKKHKDSQGQAHFNGEYEVNPVTLDNGKFDKMDISTKKRKVKQWQEGQFYPDAQIGRGHLPETSENERSKEKKPKVSKSEEKEFSTSKAGRVTRILISSSRDPLLDGVEEESRGIDEKEYELGQCQETKRTSEGTDSLKRDSGYVRHPSLAATSSSSKVSGSQKSKANFQEVKGSPVESVSSSPLRISNSDKLTNARRNLMGKDEVINVGVSIIGSPRRCSDAEYDGGNDRSGMATKEKDSSSVIDSLGVGGFDSPGRAAKHVSGDKTKDELLNVTNTNPFRSEFDNHHVGNIAATSEQPEKMDNRYSANGSCQWKSGKSSSSRSWEGQQATKSDFDKGKVKISDSLSDEQEDPFLSKSASRSRYEGDVESHDRIPFHGESRDGKYNFQKNCTVKSDMDEKKFSDKKGSKSKWFREDKRENQSKIGMHENSDVQSSPSLAKQHKDPNSRGGKMGAARSKELKSHLQQNSQHMLSREDEKSSSRLASDRIDRAVTPSGRGKSKSLPPSTDKNETQSRGGHHVIPTTYKGSKSEAVDAPGGDVTKVSKQSRKSDNPDGVHRSSSRHPTPNGLIVRDIDYRSPLIRKDSSSQTAANNALKEAKDLKHSADRLKNGGVDLESTTLYFQAALKFLHGASLLESCNVESAKHGEITQSMQVFTDTAKLCDFCAHEYERCREMAAAALAYKCMEVAHMRVIFSKHWISSKDRHELQASLQMLSHGESPSSSASDVDNLNNHGTSDKLAVAKGIVASPQIASSHIIVPRNRPNFLRLLSYAQGVNSAMEAMTKSQNAFAAATGSSEEARYGAEGLSAVRTVLDFSFHDVEGLLRLVRLAMDAISRTFLV